MRSDGSTLEAALEEGLKPTKVWGKQELEGCGSHAV